MKAGVGGSVKKRKLSKVKSSPHIVGTLVKLRREIRNKNDFSSHISKEGLLGGGVGLVLWFFNQKKSKNSSGFWEIYLGSRFAEKLCPRRHLEKVITTYLCKEGIFKVTRKAIPKVRPAYYTISEDWLKICPSELNKWQLYRLEIAHQYASDQQYERRPWLRWIDETLLGTTLHESEELQEAMRDPDTNAAASYVMRFLRRYLPPQECKTSKAKYCGTIYTPIHSCPKELIPTLLIHGEEVAQLDISAAHPSTLPKMFAEAEIKYGVAGAIKEGERLRDDLESDELYELLAEESDLTRADAKEKLLMAFNGENNHAYNDPSYRSFCKVYPVGKQVISKIKRGDKDRLNRKMAQSLGRAMDNALKTCWEHRIPCFPRTDEIVCCKKDEEFVREVLAAYFLAETGVNARVGKKRVSFLPAEDIERAGEILEDQVWKDFEERYNISRFQKEPRKSIQIELPLWDWINISNGSENSAEAIAIA